MITRWEELLIDGPGTQKIQHLINHASDVNDAWLAWGKLAQKRAAGLGLEAYRKAVHWCYALPETRACFEKEIPIETELSEIASCGHGEYYSLSALLTATLRADLTETQTSRQWAGRLIAHERALKDLAKKTLTVENQPLLHQINCAEFPWLVGCMFPDLTVGLRMLQLARDNFRLGLAEILDGSGLPHAADYMLLRPLLACWTRALMIGKKAKLRPWPVEMHNQFEWAVTHAFRLTRKDGSPMFAETEPCEVPAKGRSKNNELHVPFEFGPFADMLRHALAFDTDEADHAVGRTLFPRQFGVSEIAKTRAGLMQKPAKTTDAAKSAKKATAASKTAKKADLADAKARKERTAELVAASDATYFSEWSQMAVLRSGWDFRGPSLAVAYAPINQFRQTLADVSPGVAQQTAFCDAAPFGGWSDQSVAMELNLGGQTVWSGNWDVAVRVDGRTLLPTDTWSTTCEVSEEAGCYLEIELPLTENMRLQRHVLLCHKEKLLMTADSILPQFEDDIEEGIEHDGFNDPRFAIEYESQLPLAAGFGVKSNAETTELLLTGPCTNANTDKSQPMARVFPLALPEWKAALESDVKSDAEKPTDFISGELTFVGTNGRQRLVLRQNAFGRGMFAPMVFDLDAKRIKQQYTWRQLTVGENLEPVARDRAAAFRLQVDKMQLLLYRTMTSALNRTFFGHNLVSDFFAGRFDVKTGEVGVIVEAE